MKIDLHVHTANLSFCGHLTIEEVISLYKKTDYDAIVITDHFYGGNAEAWEEKGIDNFLEYYFQTQQKAMKLGEENGLLVLPGYEFRFPQNSNDYLVYGFTEEHAKKCPGFFQMDIAQFSEFAKENGILLYQAHPFRNTMTVVKPEYLFGIEAHNGHPRHDSRNDIAVQWAKKYNLHTIGGSDCHQIEDVGSAGIITDYPVKNITDLVHVLKNDLYTIFHN